jgi:hypothetical protein
MQNHSIAPQIRAYLAIAPLHRPGGEDAVKALPIEERVDVALDDLINLGRIMQAQADAFDSFAHQRVD